MSTPGAPQDSPSGRADGTSRTRAPGRAELALRALQGVLALWLLLSPVVLSGANVAVAVKDVLAGGLLLSLTVAAAAAGSVRRFESAVCVALGAGLIVASVLLDAGPGPDATARQWSEVVVGVLLVCLGAARAR